MTALMVTIKNRTNHLPQSFRPLTEVLADFTQVRRCAAPLRLWHFSDKLRRNAAGKIQLNA